MGEGEIGEGQGGGEQIGEGEVVLGRRRECDRAISHGIMLEKLGCIIIV